MTNKDLKDFYTYLKNIGAVSNQLEFANRIGKSRQYMSEAMNGTEKLTPAVIDKIRLEFKAELTQFKPELLPDYDKIKILKEEVARLMKANIDLLTEINDLRKEREVLINEISNLKTSKSHKSVGPRPV